MYGYTSQELVTDRQERLLAAAAHHRQVRGLRRASRATAPARVAPLFGAVRAALATRRPAAPSGPLVPCAC